MTEQERDLALLLDIYNEIKPKLVGYFMYLARQDNTAQDVIGEITNMLKDMSVNKARSKRGIPDGIRRQFFDKDITRVLKGVSDGLVKKVIEEAMAKFSKSPLEGLPSDKFSSTFKSVNLKTQEERVEPSSPTIDNPETPAIKDEDQEGAVA